MKFMGQMRSICLSQPIRDVETSERGILSCRVVDEKAHSHMGKSLMLSKRNAESKVDVVSG
jgi:hypothetical protein